MQYIGSKKRLSRWIIEVLQQYYTPGGVLYEPFCGGCNITSAWPGPFIVAGDANHYLIAFWRQIQTGWLPPICTKELYDQAKQDPDSLSPELVCWAAVNTFNSTWFGGFDGTPASAKAMQSGPRKGEIIHKSASTEARLRNVAAQAPRLQPDRVLFHCGPYMDFTGIPTSRDLVYCDPPYAGTLGYAGAGSGEFDSDAFWSWATELSETVPILVSELTAPDGWVCVWARQRQNGARADNNESQVEKLFIREDLAAGGRP